jgi:hypothetical protein
MRPASNLEIQPPDICHMIHLSQISLTQHCDVARSTKQHRGESFYIYPASSVHYYPTGSHSFRGHDYWQRSNQPGRSQFTVEYPRLRECAADDFSPEYVSHGRLVLYGATVAAANTKRYPYRAFHGILVSCLSCRFTPPCGSSRSSSSRSSL